MTNLSIAPICLFVFNRLDHTKQTIEHLQKNEFADASDIFIFSDGARTPEETTKVNAVRQYIRQISGFKSITVIERDSNWGLAKSIIDGVTTVVNKFGKVIVMEDDLVSSPYFLKFMNEGLAVYEGNPKVASIHGYVYPIENLPETFFIRGADCWGWATWKDSWAKFNPDGRSLLKTLQAKNQTREFDFDGSYPYTKMLKDQISGTNDSWAIRWYASAFVNDMYTLYPGQSLIENIGNDRSGTHCDLTNDFDVNLKITSTSIKPILIQNNIFARDQFVIFFRRTSSNRWKRFLKGFFL